MVQPYCKKYDFKIILFSLACRIGFYGYNCSYQCRSNCFIENLCDRFTGYCTGGCKPGWTGQMCDQGNFINVIIILIIESYLHIVSALPC